MTALIIDDDEALAYFLRDALEERKITVTVCHDPLVGLEIVRQDQFDLLLLDHRMPGMTGLELFRHCKELGFTPPPTIFMTAFGTGEMTIEVMKLGAVDYIQKPFDLSTLFEVLDRLQRQTVSPPVNERRDPVVDDSLIGRSRVMSEIYKRIGQIADSQANVLIMGESGTGKELFARAVHKHSARTNHPFIPLNCAAIPEALLESELFGHEKGAFTGAAARRLGRVEQADHGTLFLDEIGDLALTAQAKILRVLQDGCFERVGGTETIKTDLRVVAATNKDLEAEIKKGNFREDLFYRLSTFIIKVPALRERGEDIRELTEHFVAVFSQQYGQAVPPLRDDFIAAVEQYPWPGNVRQLRQAVHRAVVLARGAPLTRDHLVLESSRIDAALRGELEQELDAAFEKLFRDFIYDEERAKAADLLSLAERAVLRQTLRLTGYTQTRVAAILDISRTTLQKKIRQYGLETRDDG